MSSEVASPSKAEQEQSVPDTSAQTLEHDDEQVFGSLNADLADAIADSVSRHIEQGVKSLPLIKDPSKAQELANQIQKPYLRNIDIIEAYSQRNIFTLRALKPRRREKFMQRYHPSSLEESNGDSGSTTNASKLEVPPRPSILLYPSSKDDIPTSEAVESVQNEIQALTLRLEQARQKRNDLLVKSKSLEKARTISEQAVKALDPLATENPKDDVPNAVSETISKGQTLKDLTSQGEVLLEKLDNGGLSQDKENDDIEKADPAELLASVLPVKRRAPLSMEQAYRQDRKVVRTTLEDLSAFTQLLQDSTNSRS
eukprot:Nitzschia sp. Nitz4//scaffold141_size107518//29032//29970//NITZ4_004270-RA/size107518-processed-gene-0.106-mRNA-1//1//CDS//3329536270//6102//frame0